MSEPTSGPMVRTTYWAKPIPSRQFDWSAVLDSYEPGDPIGYGATEQDAINDLMEIIWDVDGDQSNAPGAMP